MEEYNIIDEILYLNSSEINLSDVDPYELAAGDDSWNNYSKYPTKYFLQEIFRPELSDWDNLHTLRVYTSLAFDIRTTNENLVNILLEISERTYWAADIALYLLKVLEKNSAYIDWYNLILDKEFEQGTYPKTWTFNKKKKYILEYEIESIYHTSKDFKNEIILVGCKLGFISVFDRNLKQFSKYIAYQGVGSMKHMSGSCGVNYYYKQQFLVYDMQVIS